MSHLVILKRNKNDQVCCGNFCRNSSPGDTPTLLSIKFRWLALVIGRSSSPPRQQLFGGEYIDRHSSDTAAEKKHTCTSHTDTHAHAHIHTRTHICTRTYTYAHAHTHAREHTHAHTHAHTHTKFETSTNEEQRKK